MSFHNYLKRIIERVSYLIILTLVLIYVALQYMHYNVAQEWFCKQGVAPHLWNLFDTLVIFAIGYICTLGRKVRWSCAISLVIAVVISISNILYARYFDSYISLSVMGESDNLPLTELLMYMLRALKPADAILVVLLVIYAIGVRYLPKQSVSRKTFSCYGLSFVPVGLFLFLVNIFNLIGNPHMPSKEEFVKNEFIPCMGGKMCEPVVTDYKFGIIRGELLYGIKHLFQITELTDEDRREVAKFLEKRCMERYDVPVTCDSCNVVMLLCESYLAVTSDMIIDGKHLTPNLDSLRHSENSLYSGDMIQDIARGQSGDGQMMYMTGLLPLSDEITLSYILDEDVPSLGGYLKERGYTTMMTIPTDVNMWHQNTVSVKYGIDKLYGAPKNNGWTDEVTFQHAIENEKKIKEPYFHTILNFSTHLPYDTPNLIPDCKCMPQHFPKEYSVKFCNYLKKVHYMDHQIGKYLAYLKESGRDERTMLVVVADHGLKEEFLDAKKSQFANNSLPVYIRVPNRKLNMGGQSLQLHSVKHQIDLFPTLLDILNIRPTGYHGIGLSLFSNDPSPSVTPEAGKVSSMIIRGGYFTKDK